jgi:hypothetical protein
MQNQSFIGAISRLCLLPIIALVSCSQIENRPNVTRVTEVFPESTIPPQTETITPSSTVVLIPTTPLPEPTAIQTPSWYSTLIIAVTEVGNAYLLYESEELGISFEYPSIYDYVGCGLRVDNDGRFGTVDLGRSSLQIQDAEGMTAEEHREIFIQQSAEWDPNFSIDNLGVGELGGEKSAAINYYFGGLSRFGAATFVVHGDRLFVLHFTAGVFCDIPEAGIYEFDAAARFGETLKFLD